jgi:hypothetical protein
MWIILLLMALLLLHLSQDLQGCYLWGTDSGECSSDTLDPIWRTEYMPFCGPTITFPVCIPKYKTLPPSREFPNGRWFNHTVHNKDVWVQENFFRFVKEREAIEQNKTLRKKNIDEYGNPGGPVRRFNHRPDCKNAYKNLFCWLNFPRCDPNRDLTLPTCRSACENFFKACVYERGLWRCGQSKYFNGYAPEIGTTGIDGNVTYMRDYFPGQPFRQNKYTKGGSELAICTPAVLGAAFSRGLLASHGVLSMVLLTVSSLCLWWGFS